MATYYFRNTGDVNWGTATNWSTTSGGAGDGAVPTAADAAILDANSGNCTLNTSARVCLTFNASAYTGTLTMSQQLTVSGNITLGAAMTIAGSGALIVSGTATLTSNGKTWPNAFTWNGTSAIHTLADSWVIGGTLTLGGATAKTVNATNPGTTLTVTGLSVGTLITTCNANLDIVMGNTGGTFTGGTGTLTIGTGRRFEINASGTVTFSGTCNIRGGTIKYTAATNVVTTGTTLTCSAATSFDCAAINWNAVQLTGTSQTWTLVDDLNVNGTLTLAGTTTQIVNGVGKFIYASGSVNLSTASLIVSGTATIVMDGTGTLTVVSTGQLRNALTIDTAGTITLGTTIVYNTGAFTYNGGTINPSTSAFTIGAVATTFTFNAPGFTFNNITCNGSAIQQFTGTDGFSCSTFTCTATTATMDMRFKEGNTYSFSSYRLNAINAFRITVRSITAGQIAYLNFSGANSREVAYTNFTDIDCSGGATVFTYYGVVSNCQNVVRLTQPVASYSFLN